MGSWHADHTFPACFTEAQVSTIADSDDCIYVLDRGLTIRGYNSAYVKFGVGNGCASVAIHFGIGCNLLTVLDPPVADFYVPAYASAMERNLRFDHDYECNSPQVYRRLHQSAYPLADGQGLVVSHHLMYEYAYPWHPQTLGPKHFDERGWLTQCACCRKVKDHSGVEKWDWVPKVVESPHPRTTAAYCGNCRAFYYGESIEWSPARPVLSQPYPAEGASHPPAHTAVGDRWTIFSKLFGGWGWEQRDDRGVLIAESTADFPTRALCEADARAHGWPGAARSAVPADSHTK